MPFREISRRTRLKSAANRSSCRLPITSPPEPATQLNPTFDKKGERVVTLRQFEPAVPAGMLGSSIRNAEAELNKISAAVDLLMQAFELRQLHVFNINFIMRLYT